VDGSTASEARRLRVEEQLSAGQIRQRLGLSKDQLYAALRGVPPPAWTRRPNAKDELRARAIELRGEGWSVNDIALELQVASRRRGCGSGTCRSIRTANAPAESASTRSG
jgi:hypothetical protein